MTGLKLIGLAAAFGLCAATAQAQSAGDWAHFGGTLGDTKYSALDQINAGTINRLKVAWRAGGPPCRTRTAIPVAA
jgi:glucose dehydrogenase